MVSLCKIDKSVLDLVIVISIAFAMIYSISTGFSDMALAAMSGLLGFLTGKSLSSENSNNTNTNSNGKVEDDDWV